MSEPAASAPAPSGDAGAQPQAPAPTPAPDNQQPAPQQPTHQADTGADADQSEWDNAADELFPGIRSTQKQEDKKDEQAQSAQAGQEAGTPKGDSENQAPDGQPGADNAAGEGGEGSEEDGGEGGEGEGDEGQEQSPEDAAREARALAQQNAQYQQTFRDSVRSQMFAQVPKTMVDADGDPINGPEDVMRLINPTTQEQFTEEEAREWYRDNQTKFEKNLTAVEGRINEIADVNIGIKDQADYINDKYGSILKANPELQKRLWTQYQATLEVDPQSKVITKAPVSLRDFYEVALEPYAKQAPQTPQAPQQQQPAPQPQAPAEDPNKKRQATRSDRSDIFGGGQQDIRDDEDKEWDQAATTVFGPLKP